MQHLIMWFVGQACGCTGSGWVLPSANLVTTEALANMSTLFADCFISSTSFVYLMLITCVTCEPWTLKVTLQGQKDNHNASYKSYSDNLLQEL